MDHVAAGVLDVFRADPDFIIRVGADLGLGPLAFDNPEDRPVEEGESLVFQDAPEVLDDRVVSEGFVRFALPALDDLDGELDLGRFDVVL
ncbi:MAG: hypothetical protein FJY82_04555, partial [Candidatus Aminicenantes bacterium]|nr:hypothetical protein [Candidatus Aminicenantes bacterium]